MDSTEKNNPYLSDPDVGLMLSFQNGEQSSFEKLMRKYYPRLLNFIFRYLNNREAAEDLTQEVFIKVYNNVGRYEVKSKFQTWLFTIAKNLSLNELRRLKRKFVSMDAIQNVEGEELKRQFEDTNVISPKEEIEEEEKAQKVREAISDLPENQRVAVLLRRYEGFSYEEIAQIMEVSLKAVKSLLSRAKENLKNHLQAYVSQEDT